MSCFEEEFSFCLSWWWRRRAHWRPTLLFYGRGVAGPFPLLVPLLSLAGLWRFVRRPVRLSDFPEAQQAGATVTGFSTCLGSTGMGGTGFVGLRLKPGRGDPFWIVVTLYGAASWLKLGDRLLAEGYAGWKGQDLPVSLQTLVGSALLRVELTRTAAVLIFSTPGGEMPLRVAPEGLPQFSPGEPRMLDAAEDLRDAIIVSRRASLWL